MKGVPQIQDKSILHVICFFIRTHTHTCVHINVDIYTMYLCFKFILLIYILSLFMLYLIYFVPSPIPHRLLLPDL